jgi:sigma-E factor negative regulatory protein RseB
MMKQRRILTVTAAGVALGSMLLSAYPALGQGTDPHLWLEKMTGAVRTTNYEGTVIRMQAGTSEALKVVHLVMDGVVHERVLVQEGSGLEIIRNGNEVQCILPDKRSVLVEEWADQSTLFSTLPQSDIQFGSEYDVSIVREERVAGRKALMLAIRPHDEYRYGHRVWLDIETGFPLQTKLIDVDGDTLAQVKFADINLDAQIDPVSLQPSYNIENFRWINQPQRNITHYVDAEWSSDDLPPGFRTESAHEEYLPGSDERVTHILIGDGLASVSVFVKPKSARDVVEQSKVGLSSSFSIAAGEHFVTAVGEVPAATLEQIARSMRPK